MILLLLACTPDLPLEVPTPATRETLSAAVGLGVLKRADPAPVLGTALPYGDYTVQPISIQVYADYRMPGALWLPAGPGPHPAVLMAHGHFGQGKSAGEVQGPAHALATNGYVVLAIDTPGVEEGHRPDRLIHLDGGAANRAALVEHGTTALAVQLEALQAGLDVLQARDDVGEIAVAGASGGAVQSAWLLLLDPRPVAGVMASPVPIPHWEPGGCGCDVVPALTGPRDDVLSLLDDPTLWMAEDGRARFPELPDSATWVHVPGPHGYEPPMIQHTLDFLGPLLGGGTTLPERLPNTPQGELQSTELGDRGLPQLR